MKEKRKYAVCFHLRETDNSTEDGRGRLGRIIKETSLLGPVLRDLEDVLELEVSAVVIVHKLCSKTKTSSETNEPRYLM